MRRCLPDFNSRGEAKVSCPRDPEAGKAYVEGAGFSGGRPSKDEAHLW